jgi:hypothetical protein
VLRPFPCVVVTQFSAAKLMPTDIKIDEGDGSWVVVEADVLKTTAAELMLDSPHRRQPGGAPLRRALVHDTNDGLTINFNGDYRGGVTIVGSLVVSGGLAVSGDVRTGSVPSIGDVIAALQDVIAGLQTTADTSRSRLDALEQTVTQLVVFAGAAVIPAWRTKTEVEDGDDMGLVSRSAKELGLLVEFTFDRQNPNFQHEDVINISPPAGTLVSRGSTVVVEINLEG